MRLDEKCEKNVRLDEKCVIHCSDPLLREAKPLFSQFDISGRIKGTSDVIFKYWKIY